MSNQHLARCLNGAEVAEQLSSQIGIDLGGTSLDIGRVHNGKIEQQSSLSYNALASESEIVNFVIASIEQKINDSVTRIGIGVPSVVDIERGVVLDAANIPSWKEVPLKALLESRFNIPVVVNNDVNCFVVGEQSVGVAQNFNSVVGICLGTGMGVGLIINGQLYAGNTCGAGELGETHYRDGILENYCSGQFFQRFYGAKGKEVFVAASSGDVDALRILHELGHHVGAAIATCLLAYDPQMVILGGSVSKSYSFFKAGMEEALKDFPFQTLLKRCRIEVSRTEHVAVLGAAALTS